MDGVYYTKALKNSREHSKDYKSDSRKNDFLTILNMILVASTGIANNVVTFSGANTLLSVVLYLSLIITGIQKYYDYAQSAEKHRIISILYATLCENIKDEKIPCQYIRSQYQLLRAIGPGLVEVDDQPTATSTEPVDVVENERDHELDYELRRMNSI
jgi:hypothetical protein